MMYRHNNMAVNLKDIRTMQITEGMGRSASRWSIAITYCDNHSISINGLEREEAVNLFSNIIKTINGGK